MNIGLWAITVFQAKGADTVGGYSGDSYNGKWFRNPKNGFEEE